MIHNVTLERTDLDAAIAEYLKKIGYKAKSPMQISWETNAYPRPTVEVFPTDVPVKT